MQSQLDLVRQVRAQYGPTMTDDECGRLVNAIAYRLAQTDPAWGLSAKPTGKGTTLPNGQRIAHDILHYRTTNTLIDVLGAAGAESVPQWAEVAYHGDPAGRPWLAAVDPATFASGPAPAPAPAGPSLAVLEALVQTLAQRVDVMAARIDLLTHNSTQTAEGVQRLEAAQKAGLPVRLSLPLLGRVSGTVGGA